MEISGKTVFITGASSGIGYDLAKLFAYEKCNLVLLARRKDLLDDLAEKLKQTGSSIFAIKCDVGNKREIADAVESVKEKFGAIDIAVLNSGVNAKYKIEKLNSEDADRIFGVNVIGLTYCIEALLPDFINRKSGMIVGVSSLADGRGFPQNGFYCASKAAATKLLESLRVDLKKYNIKVLTVKPGFVKTPMTDKNDFKMPFLMPVDKASRIILNGIKKEKRTIQFPLPTVLGAKFLKIIPDFLFDIFASKI